MVTLVKILWGGSPVTGGGVSTLCFEDPVDNTAAIALAGDVGDFAEALSLQLDEDLTIEVQANPARYAAATGELQEIFSVPSPFIDVGQIGGNAAPRATQGLIRWSTADIVNGRLVKGRTFIPGVPAIHCTDAGGLSSTFVDALDAAAEALITATGGTLEIWHRPVAGAGGSTHLVTSASAWNQFAVLRSRRD